MEALWCLLDTPGLRVSYDPANNWLYNQWLGEHTGSSVLAGAALVAQCLRAQPCPKILSDHSELRGDWQAAAPLVGSQGLARLAAQGVGYFAWVYSPYHTHRAAMERALLGVEAPAVSIFDDLAEACEWLQRIPDQAAPRAAARQPLPPPAAGAFAARGPASLPPARPHE